MAQAAATLTRVASPDITSALKVKAFEDLGIDLIEIMQMARLASPSIEDSLEQKPFDGKPGLLFIDPTHRDTLIFAAQHLQDMIDNFRGKFFDIVEGASAENPRVGEVRDRDQR